MKTSLNKLQLNYGVTTKIVDFEGIGYPYIQMKTKVTCDFPVESIKKRSGLRIYPQISKPTKNYPDGKIYFWIKFAAPFTKENETFVTYICTLLKDHQISKINKKFNQMVEKEHISKFDIMQQKPGLKQVDGIWKADETYNAFEMLNNYHVPRPVDSDPLPF